MTSKAITEFDMLLQEERIISREEGIESERHRIMQILAQKGVMTDELASLLCEPKVEYKSK